MVVCPMCRKVTGGSMSNKAHSRYYKCHWELSVSFKRFRRLKENTIMRLLNGVAAAACLLALLAPMAQAKHDSNTLNKLGRAIEYPVRKASENTSIAAHRAVGAKSVVHRRNGNKTYRSVVTSNGRIHRLHRVGHRY